MVFFFLLHTRTLRRALVFLGLCGIALPNRGHS